MVQKSHSFHVPKWVRLAAAMAAFFAGFPACEAETRRQSAPDFTLMDINGKTFSLKDYRGKVVLLDFWATWCPPCVISSPEVEKVAQEFKGKNFEVIRVSLDDGPDAVKAYLSTHKLTGRVAMTNGDVERLYRVQGIPAFYIIDKSGSLVKSWGGYHPLLPQIWRKEINRLLS